MSRRGNCYDNTLMEAFFSTVKNEVGERDESHGDAKGQLFHHIEAFYNQRRRHSSANESSGVRTQEDSSRVTKPSTQTDQAHGEEGAVGDHSVYRQR